MLNILNVLNALFQLIGFVFIVLFAINGLRSMFEISAWEKRNGREFHLQ